LETFVSSLKLSIFDSIGQQIFDGVDVDGTVAGVHLDSSSRDGVRLLRRRIVLDDAYDWIVRPAAL